MKEEGSLPERTLVESSGQVITADEEMRFADTWNELRELDIDGVRQLGRVGYLVRSYLLDYKALPVGQNRDFAQALLGDNLHATNYLPEGHPVINSDGELVDIWGSPFSMHVFSRSAVEIRSAGPDKLYRTEDDLLWQSDPYAQANVRL